MGLPAAAVAGRFAWVGYRDRIPFLARREAAPDADVLPAVDADPTRPTPDRDDEPVGVA